MANFFKVRESEKALGVIAAKDARVNSVGILWLPKSKVLAMMETDERSPKIVTNKGTFMGTPLDLSIDSDFAAKLGLA